jgi:predicted RNA-binding Zn-ribbon protein involved in translation (DUF1610 family)
MASKFNCPNCGAPNTYGGEGNAVVCSYCGQEVRPPEEMVNQAAVARFSSKAKVWIILFIIVVFVLPTCIGFGGTLIGIAASIIGFFASFIGAFFH